MELSFPLLLPRLADPIWVSADIPKDDENLLCKLEQQHMSDMLFVREKYSDIIPIGKPAADTIDDEEDPDHDDEDDLDTNDGDVDTDMLDTQDSPEDLANHFN